MVSLKVALVSEEFPPFSFGGIASNCSDLAYSLSEKGIETAVFAGRANKITIEQPNDYLKVIRLPCLNFPPRFIWFQLQNFSILSKMLKDYSVIHVVNPQVGSICAHLKEKLDKPLVTTIHGLHLQSLKTFVNSPVASWTIGDLGLFLLEYPLMEFSTRQCLNRSDHVIICGESVYNEMNKIYPRLNPDSISMITNGIRFHDIERIPTSERNKSTDLLLMFYGRFYDGKGIEHLLKATSILIKKFPNLRLEFFGKGPLEGKMKNWIKTLKLENNVALRGYFQRNNLLKEVQKADIVVLPSLWEVGPFVAALEAMALKKPLVVFDMPFTREFIKNNETGLLVKPGNVNDLAEKISSLCSDKKMCNSLGKKAYEYIKQRHNWATLVEEYIDVYESVVR